LDEEFWCRCFIYLLNEDALIHLIVPTRIKRGPELRIQEYQVSRRSLSFPAREKRGTFRRKQEDTCRGEDTVWLNLLFLSWFIPQEMDVYESILHVSGG
jgi:hypothetical protein